MGFLDNIKSKFGGGSDDDYYEDDYYDDDQGGYDDAPVASSQPATSGVLGNTRRPEAESVSVYTRSGRPVGDNAGAASAAYGGAGSAYASTRPARDEYAQQRQEAYQRRSSSYDEGYDDQRYASRGGSVLGNTTGGNTPADIGLKPIPRMRSNQLPPYVLKPVSYDDVQMVVRRVRTNQPVVLVFRNTNIETAKRILDFSLGLATGVGGQVDGLGDRVFAVMPQGVTLSDADIDRLVADGTIER